MPDEADEPDLLTDIRARLGSGEPLDVLAQVSGLVAATDPRLQSPLTRSASREELALPSLEELVDTFDEVHSPETTALLAGIAHLAPDAEAAAPELLRALIRYAHRERGIRPGLTADTLAAVDEWEPDYQRVIRSPRPQGPAALLAAMVALDPPTARGTRTACRRGDHDEGGRHRIGPLRRLPGRRPRHAGPPGHRSPPEEHRPPRPVPPGHVGAGAPTRSEAVS